MTMVRSCENSFFSELFSRVRRMWDALSGNHLEEGPEMAQRRLRAELARLASTAPHLLADIGLEPEGRGGRAWSGAGYRVVRTPPAGESEVEILADAG